MPRFKTNKNIFVDLHEEFDQNWMDSDHIQLPPSQKWDYGREMNIDDVELWEVLYEQGGGTAVYASWLPHAEFYMIRVGWNQESKGWGQETYYGSGAARQVFERAKELGIKLPVYTNWVENDELWLYHSS